MVSCVVPSSRRSRARSNDATYRRARASFGIEKARRARSGASIDGSPPRVFAARALFVRLEDGDPRGASFLARVDSFVSGRRIVGSRVRFPRETRFRPEPARRRAVQKRARARRSASGDSSGDSFFTIPVPSKVDMKSTDVASVTEPSWRSIDPSNSSSFSEPSGSSSEVEVSFAESTNASSGGRGDARASSRSSRIRADVFDESSLARTGRGPSAVGRVTRDTVVGHRHDRRAARETSGLSSVCTVQSGSARVFRRRFRGEDSFLIASSLASSTVSSRGGLFESGDPAWAES